MATVAYAAAVVRASLSRRAHCGGERGRCGPERCRQVRVNSAQLRERRHSAQREAQRRVRCRHDAGGRLPVPGAHLHRGEGDEPAEGRARTIPRGVETICSLVVEFAKAFVEAEGAAGGARLDRVAECGASAVQLQPAHPLNGKLPRLQRQADHRRLGGPVRGGQGPGAPVLVHGRPSQHHVCATRRRLVLVGRPRRRQHDDPGALSTHVAVGGGVQRLAAAVRCEHPRGVARHGGGGREREVYPRNERLAARGGVRSLRRRPERVRLREVQRHQRGGAGGVQADRRPGETESVREPPGGHAQRAPGGRVAARGVQRPRLRAEGLVLRSGDANKHARGAAIEQSRVPFHVRLVGCRFASVDVWVRHTPGACSSVARPAVVVVLACQLQ
eukprot:5153603-Pyramimonas_sp.AAC.3